MSEVRDAAGRAGSVRLGDATPDGVLVEDFEPSVRGPHPGFDDETLCPVLVALLTGPKATETDGLEVQASNPSGRALRLWVRPSRRRRLLTRPCGGLGRPVRDIDRHRVEATPATAQFGGSVSLPASVLTLDPDYGCHADHDHDASAVDGDVLD
jgi:hypothetical protein